ncbi:MAG: FAD-binding oxidoreductase [Actinomycetota bacterium]|nr:FAD-binding oxidoreductase [Actinomycetota bacterium]
MKSCEIETRWWGWGDVKKTYDVEEVPAYVEYLKKRLELEIDCLRIPDPDMGKLELRPVRLSKKTIGKFEKIVGKENLSTDKKARLYHALGKSYRDILRARMGQVPNPPDVVVFPANEKEISEILGVAEEERVSVVPFCGGSSVVGGVEPLEKEEFSGSLTVDLRRMDRLIFADAQSMRARFEAGIWGPELEKRLSKHGLYLGHGPESFLFSGLGGWIASRGAGRQSTGYGKIEDMTEALRIVTPRGTIDTLDVPASAAGPDLVQLICGSEGTLGIITEATMKVRPLPEVYDYQGLLFKEFSAGVESVREMLQKGVVPELVRISDPEESTLGMYLRKPSSNPVKEKATVSALKGLEKFGFSFETGSYAVVGCEGKAREAHSRMRKALSICVKNGAIPLGASAGREWYDHRYDNPYLRDIMYGWGVMTDTLETATTWDNMTRIHERVGKAISDALLDYGSKSIVTCHLSHSYRTGSSLYFIFLGKIAKGKEIEQWEHLKEKAGDEILSCGATISHHHGIGYEHVTWFEKQYGEQGLSALRSVKNIFDPAGMMNPGKLGL